MNTEVGQSLMVLAKDVYVMEAPLRVQKVCAWTPGLLHAWTVLCPLFCSSMNFPGSSGIRLFS